MGIEGGKNCLIFMRAFSGYERIALGCTKMKLVVTQLEEFHMTRPRPPSLREASRAETAISSMIFCTGILIDGLSAELRVLRRADWVGEGRSLTAPLLAGGGGVPALLRRRRSPAGRAGPDRPR